ncbi:hypothetical protein DsansV1_C04g0047051 [Dioscorea sansibarensis]
MMRNSNRFSVAECFVDINEIQLQRSNFQVIFKNWRNSVPRIKGITFISKIINLH